MPPEIRTETQRLVRMTFGTVTMISEREVTIITDLRPTPFGVFDFGFTVVGSVRWVRDSTPG